MTHMGFTKIKNNFNITYKIYIKNILICKANVDKKERLIYIYIYI